MPTAFIVLAHGEPTTFSHLARHLRGFPTFVHLDRSADPAPFERMVRQQGLHALQFVQPRRCLHWGGYSIVMAMMESLAQAIGEAPSDVGHFAFLSGQCFPLQPVQAFCDHLEVRPQLVWCRGFDMARHPRRASMGSDRVRHRYWFDGAVGHFSKVAPHAVGAAVRRALTGVTWPFTSISPLPMDVAGSQWTALPRALAVELVAHYGSGGFDYLRHALAPDEIAVPSYVYNSRWAAATPSGGLEPSQGATMAAYANFHWLKGGLRGTVSREDVDMALRSEKFFVRKVSETATPGLCDYITAQWRVHRPGGRGGRAG
ncbi:hypothetical protein [Ramlibacter rhizophilus]|uniref:Glycosyl transferase n=1 Tax=Ramlibacter rhizophilus TaxID=1781167 RepID=A0A4Z0BCB4_9BURK|nr:hypothetical protein [Ramlibacter rhizophilus]TFY96886.1 hypothetical protein EZ242_19630 [Ramlibacter rhizophilus]